MSRHRRRRPPGHLELLLEVRIADEDLEHEAVLLGFRQRVGAFLLDGVLRGQDEERIAERVPHPAHRHLPLLHGFQQGRLRLRRRAVDFVGQDHVGEQRALEEAELAVAGRAVLHDHVRPRNVGGREVGRELDAAEAQVERAAQGADHQRLGQARHAFQKAMPAAEQADEQFFDDRRLPHDDLAQLVHDLAAGGVEFLDGGGILAG